MAFRSWSDLTTDDVARLDREGAVVVQPVAAIEQHGPHLPLATDLIINQGVIEQASRKAPKALDVLVLPALCVGVSPEHRDFPGTLTLAPATLLSVLAEIADSIARAGLRRTLMVNSHGGQPGLLDAAAQDMRTRHAMLALVINTWQLMRPREAFSAEEVARGLHGGAIETSLVLHLRPDLVRRNKVADFPSAATAWSGDTPELAPKGMPRFAWQVQDLNVQGAVGDARLARAEIGASLVEQAADALLAILGDAARLPLAGFNRRS